MRERERGNEMRGESREGGRREGGREGRYVGGRETKREVITRSTRWLLC